MKGLAVSLSLTAGLLLCRASVEAGGGRPPGKQAKSSPPIVELIFEGGLKGGWRDYGWAPRTLGPGAAELTLSAWGGWILAHPGLTGTYGGVTFRLWAPPSFGDFLEVRVDDGSARMFPQVSVTAKDRHRLTDPAGGEEVWISMADLDPEHLPFDRIVIRAREAVGTDVVRLDRIGLTAPVPGAPLPQASAPSRSASLKIDCSVVGRPIKPTIYGVAFDAQRDGREPPWGLNPGARRWGGNPTSRYNWKIGAWNTASDWFYRNVQVGPPGTLAHQTFLDDDARHRVASAFTLPLMGWVARDTSEASFPTATFGTQQQSDPDKPGIGNGMSPDGRPLPPGPPSRTSTSLAPDDIGRFVTTLRDASPRHSPVDLYYLDNEPMLWNSTHRDVHPAPVSYDELLTRTVDYAAAVRKADPQAVIAGPALWGWPAYFYSAVDAQAGFRAHPDRAAHGDEPLLPWYLRKLRDHERRTGVRLLDVVDVHFYPQGSDIRVGTGGGTSRDTCARRLRATRALWDPTYVDESWIGEPIELIPRLRRWINASYPGRGISIGEWSFGAEDHMSGALAIAESLGRFGQLGVDYAFYWTYPNEGTPAAWAFRAFRNFDGSGARFLDTSLPTNSPAGTSFFASRDESRGHLVAIALNLDPDQPVEGAVQLENCGEAAGRVFTYTGGPSGFASGPQVQSSAGRFSTTLAPYSITVFDLVRQEATAERGKP